MSLPVRESAIRPLEGKRDEAARIAETASQMPPAVAGFSLGQLYTTLLPSSLRKSLGAYYTPPALVERLLRLVTESGFDWKTGNIVDPACGGAAFLASLAPRLIPSL